jgi:long-chain acyl-CoA synthetase
MTETCATCSKTIPDDGSAGGTIGPPLPVNEVKLIDVSTMGYLTDDKPNPRGELCVRGANCFTTYHKGMHQFFFLIVELIWRLRREEHERGCGR